VDAVEVIRYSGEELLDLLRAGPGEQIVLGDGVRLLRVAHAGRSARLRLRPGMTGTVVSRGVARVLAAGKRRVTVRLRAGDCGQIRHHGASYLLRFIQTPSLPRRKLKLRLTRGSLLAVAASVAAHLVILSGLVQGASSIPTAGEEPPPIRLPAAAIQLEDLRPAPQLPPAPPERALHDRSAPRARRAGVVRGQPAGERRGDRRASFATGASGMLAVLQRAASAMPERSDLGALAGNLSAVRSRVTATSLRLSGPVGRGGVGVQLGGGGGEEGSRRGLRRLGEGGTGALVARAGTGRREPLAMLPASPTIRPLPDVGRLDRAAIQRVISQHLHEIQACYERALLRHHKLIGKIVLDWTIEQDGTVSQARLVTPGLGEVGSCVLQSLRSWRFPRPEGGTVPIRYPFIFRVTDF
jgi:hypothetical protein